MSMCSDRFVVGDLQGLIQAGLLFLLSSALCSVFCLAELTLAMAASEAGPVYETSEFCHLDRE